MPMAVASERVPAITAIMDRLSGIGIMDRLSGSGTAAATVTAAGITAVAGNQAKLRGSFGLPFLRLA